MTMDGVLSALLRVVEPFVYPLLPQTRFYWLYMLTALVLAYVVYRRTAASAAPRPRFLEFALPKDIYLHRSALVDYRYFLVNHFSFVFLLAPLLLSAALVASFATEALEDLIGPSPQWGVGGAGAVVVYTIVVALAYDFGIFAGHTLLHRVAVLWEFHKVHHSAEVLTPVTVYRVHPLEDLLYGITTGILTGLAHGMFAYGAGEKISTATVLNVDAALFAFYVVGYNLRHSHIWLAYPGWLSRILVSPAQHQIHHSTDPRHLDKNMGFMFSVWDWMAGSLYVAKAQEKLTFGLGDASAARDYDGVLALYFVPFRNLFQRWRPKWLART
jgi:sterol desaturase/sphingolipid hydroxylase (fatty acid hydroxylase superfamily)